MNVYAFAFTGRIVYKLTKHTTPLPTGEGLGVGLFRAFSIRQMLLLRQLRLSPRDSVGVQRYGSGQTPCRRD